MSDPKSESKLDAKVEQKAAAADGDYEAVTGLDKQSVECVRAFEEKAAAKTASDYAHVIWAYGVLWSLFAIFGVLLWRRAKAQQADLDELRRRLDRASK
jgi:hypothetical protein